MIEEQSKPLGGPQIYDLSSSGVDQEEIEELPQITKDPKDKFKHLEKEMGLRLGFGQTRLMSDEEDEEDEDEPNMHSNEE